MKKNKRQPGPDGVRGADDSLRLEPEAGNSSVDSDGLTSLPSPIADMLERVRAARRVASPTRDKELQERVMATLFPSATTAAALATTGSDAAANRVIPLADLRQVPREAETLRLAASVTPVAGVPTTRPPVPYLSNPAGVNEDTLYIDDNAAVCIAWHGPPGKVHLAGDSSYELEIAQPGFARLRGLTLQSLNKLWQHLQRAQLRD